MTRKSVFLILAVVVLVFAVANVAVAAGPTYKFAFIIYDTAGNPFWRPVVEGANETAKMLGVQIDVQFAGDQPDKQNDFIETAMTKNVDGIALVINVPDAYNKNIDRAMKAGIPVIAFNIDDPKGAEGNSRMAFVGQSFPIAGYLVTKRLIKEYHIGKGDKVVCPVEHPEATYAKYRFAGVKQALDEVGATGEVLDTGAISLEDSLNKLTQYMLGHRDTKATIGLGFMSTSVGPKASADSGLNIPCAGFDMSKQIVQDIIDGKLVATVDQQPFYQGAFSVFQLYFYKKYGLQPCEINTGGALIDKSNAALALKLSGTYR